MVKTVRYFVGIDDTDYGISIGTGALAREVDLFLRRHLGATSFGITRHQLLVHPDIPYTSHNSSACIELEVDASEQRVVEEASRLLRFLQHDGADPGLCVLAQRPMPELFFALGKRATQEVLQKAEFSACAAELGVALLELGGTGLGIIGALSACALRMSGDNGRFISKDGLRDIQGAKTVGELLRLADVSAVFDDAGARLGEDCIIETRGWVRPALRGGRPVLDVVRDGARYVIHNRKREEE